MMIKANAGISEIKFIENEIARWKRSPQRKAMLDGERYYKGEHDILKRRRQAIGEGGTLQDINNLPNNRIVDNQYGKMVDQKVNYLLGKPLTLDTEEAYKKVLSEALDKRFNRLMKCICEDSVNCGIAWLYVYYDEDSKLCFKHFAPYEILPFWADNEHTVLDMAVRVYPVEVYSGMNLQVVEKVEVYKDSGIEYYEFKNNCLVPDEDRKPICYLTIEEKPHNWERIPLIAFKFNNKEIPLINRVKSLQDAINTTLSDFENNMQEDYRNTILVLKNYEGQNLGEFRQNLATYGVVKVKAQDGIAGGVDALTVEVNSENYKAILDLLKKALIENAMGFDAKDDRLSGAPNQMNIQSMYSDIELDANNTETEYQAAFDELLELLNWHFNNMSKGDFTGSDVNIIFNRDMLMNEAEIIQNINASMTILSRETLVAQHPWVTNVDEELRRYDEERQQEISTDYKDGFINGNTE